MPIHRRMLMSAGAAGRLVEFKLWGAAGGRSHNMYQGGPGGAATGSFYIPAGTVLKIVAGQRGASYAFTSTAPAHPGGGTIAHTYGGSTSPGMGGGYSGVFVGSITQANALLIAGGGGGGGYAGNGGPGGGVEGDRAHLVAFERTTHGFGGTQSAGGAGGSGSGYSLQVGGGAGGALQGGAGLGPQADGFSGAGGGGGYFGGGAGAAENSRAGGGGGGGSGFRNTSPPAGIVHVTSALYLGTYNSSSPSPGNGADPDRGHAGNNNAAESLITGGRVLLRVDGGPWLAFGPSGAEHTYTVPSGLYTDAGDTWDAGWSHQAFSTVGTGNGKTASANTNHNSWHLACSRRGYSTGKVYLEFLLNTVDSASPNFGLLPRNIYNNTSVLYSAGTAWNGGAFYGSGGNIGTFGSHSGSLRCMYAIDFDARTIRIGQNGVWLNGGASVHTFTSGQTWFFCLSQYNGNLSATVYTDAAEQLYRNTTSNGFNATAAGYAAWLA